MKQLCFYDTEIGRIAIAGTDRGITNLFFDLMALSEGYEEQETPLLANAAVQLREYLAGKRQVFDLPLLPQGTEFQRRVWNALCSIPYGETRTYREIAAQTGNENASRAVGLANNRNPIPVLIPCHRVIGADGSLTGYAGGLEMKKQLLDLEQARVTV